MFQSIVSVHSPKDHLIPAVGFQPLGDGIPEWFEPIRIEWKPRIEYWQPDPVFDSTGNFSSHATQMQMRVVADPRGDIDKISSDELQQYRTEMSQRFSEDLEKHLMAGLWSDVNHSTMATDCSTTTHTFSYQHGTYADAVNTFNSGGTTATANNNPHLTTTAFDSAITTAGDSTWAIWVNDHYEHIEPPAQYQHEVWGSWNDVVNESQEERESRVREAAAVREHMEERRRQRETVETIANAKADELLKAVLNDEQRADYDLNRSFVVVLKNTSYRLKKGRTGNVKELDRNGREIASYCIHPAMQCPNADTLVAQKFMLETDEAEFKRVANRRSMV